MKDDVQSKVLSTVFQSYQDNGIEGDDGKLS